MINKWGQEKRKTVGRKEKWTLIKVYKRILKENTRKGSILEVDKWGQRQRERDIKRKL